MKIRTIKSKKASFMLLFFIFLLVLAIGYFYVNLSKAETQFRTGIKLEGFIGNLQLSTIKTYQEADNLMFYIDRAAKHAADSAVDGLVFTITGRHNENLGCGEYNGYVLWQSFDTATNTINDCFPEPEIITGDFMVMFSSTFYDYMRNYKFNIPQYLYEFTLKTTDTSAEVLGIAKQKIELKIIPLQSISEYQPEPQQPIQGNTPNEEIVSVKHGYVTKCAGTCLLSKDAAERLKKAQKIAEGLGYHLYVYESYRTEEMQASYWELYNHNLKLACGPDASGSFAACPHRVAGAVDVKFSDASGKPKSMTSQDWDDLTNKIMTRAEFEPYPAEPWHFEYGTVRWQQAQTTTP